MKKINFNVYCLWLSLVFSTATLPMDKDFAKNHIDPIATNEAALRLLYDGLKQQDNRLGWSSDSDDQRRSYFLRERMSKVSAALQQLRKNQRGNSSVRPSVDPHTAHIRSMLSGLMPVQYQVDLIQDELAGITTNEAALKQFRNNLVQEKSHIFCTDYDSIAEYQKADFIVDGKIKQVEKALKAFYANQPK